MPGLVTPAYTTTASPWTFQLANLATGANVADITKLSERELKFGLSAPSTYAAKMDLAHPAMPLVAASPHFLVKAYRRNVLKEIFECQTGELVGNEQEHSVKITGQSAGYKELGMRHIGQSAVGTIFTNVDRVTAIAQALAEANTASDIGVRIGGATQSAGAVTAGPFRYKNLLQLINDLGRTLSGYDHWVTPLDPAIWGDVGALNMAPIRGALREHVTLEYGTGRANAREYKLFWNNSDRITRAICLPPSFPDNAGLKVKTAVNAYDGTAGIRRREALIDNDLPDDTLRQLLANEHVAVRAEPQQIFTIQPHVYDVSAPGRVPQFLQHYDIGDIVEGRIVDQGLVFLNALVRIYGATVNLDDAGVEEVTLVTVQEDS